MMVMFTFPLSAISEEKYIICPTDKIEKGNAEIFNYLFIGVGNIYMVSQKRY